MEQINFADVAKLINRIGTLKIQLPPISEEKTFWALHTATIEIGGIRTEVSILYLLADATMEGTQRARTILGRNKDISKMQIVYADSLQTRSQTVLKSFDGKAASILSLTEYFACFIRNHTEIYVEKIKSLDFKNYVDPEIEISDTFVRRTPNPVRSFLLDPDQSGAMFSGTLGVLLGEPGQGKTFMTRYLANECATRKAIPIYVHSEQWYKMQPDEISSLWKTIVHSFRFFEAPIGWVDGAEEAFLRVALRTGLFRIIFDGLDEYILWNNGAVDAIDTIRSLQELSDATGTRILVSSRTSFWESEIVDADGVDDQRAKHIFKILPFDENNAVKYFSRRFSGDDSKSKEATKLFRALRAKLHGSATEFLGRGFFLTLIADLIARDYTLDAFHLDEQTVFGWMVTSLCEREEKRQRLPITVTEQVDVLSEFAEFILKGEPPSSENLALVIQGVANLSEADADSLASYSGKLKDHPLIRCERKRDWCFVQEQVWFNLLAQRLIGLGKTPAPSKSLADFVTAKGFDLQVQANVASALIEQLFEMYSLDDAIDRIKAIVKSLLQVNGNAPGQVAGNPASLATITALTTTNRRMVHGSSHAERTEFMRALFPGSRFAKLFFSGSLARFDFSTSEFDSCVFYQVGWANCLLTDETKFNQCRFVGGLINSCKGFGSASFATNCLYDPAAKHTIESESIRSGKREYSREDLRLDITNLATKFIPRDGLGVKTVEERSLSRGPLSMSIHKEKIIDAFKRILIEPHILTGSSETGYHVRELARDSFSYFSTNGVFIGPLADVFADLKEKLSLK